MTWLFYAVPCSDVVLACTLKRSRGSFVGSSSASTYSPPRRANAAVELRKSNRRGYHAATCWYRRAPGYRRRGLLGFYATGNPKIVFRRMVASRSAERIAGPGAVLGSAAKTDNNLLINKDICVLTAARIGL